MNIDLNFDEDILLKAFFDATTDMTKKEIKDLRIEFEKGEFQHKWTHQLRWLKDVIVDAAERSADICI